jgi:SAM-dependent methyltransferase
MHQPIHPLDRCGLAPASDLERLEVRQLQALLEREQADFLAREADFRSPSYPWPRDALHNWSRVWEYPYVHHHVQRWLATQPAGRLPLLVDVGCGVTFLPFALARQGLRVVGLDTDPLCVHDLARAAAVVQAAPGGVEARCIVDGRLPLADGEADGAICVSVLEHIPDFAASIADIARVLKPGGLLVLTLDMSWRDDHAITAGPFQQLRTSLEERFTYVHPQTSVHPGDLLRSDRGPLRLTGPTGLARAVAAGKQYLLKPLLGRRPRPLAPLLSVWAAVLQRKP